MIIVIVEIQPGWNFIEKYDIDTRLVLQKFDIGPTMVSTQWIPITNGWQTTNASELSIQCDAVTWYKCSSRCGLCHGMVKLRDWEYKTLLHSCVFLLDSPHVLGLVGQDSLSLYFIKVINCHNVILQAGFLFAPVTCQMTASLSQPLQATSQNTC